MSAEYKGQDPLDIAKQAERDLNSDSAKFGAEKGYGQKDHRGVSDSSMLQQQFFDLVLTSSSSRVGHRSRCDQQIPR